MRSLFKTIEELRRTQILREMDKQKKEAEEIIEAEAEQTGFIDSNYAEAGETNYALNGAAQIAHGFAETNQALSLTTQRRNIENKANPVSLSATPRQVF